jgi:hypothetical protein
LNLQTYQKSISKYLMKPILHLILIFITTKAMSQGISDYLIFNKTHPYVVTVKPTNLTIELLDSIKMEYPNHAIRAQADISDIKTNVMLINLGFIPMRTTWAGEIEVEKINVEPFENALLTIKKSKLKIGKLPKSLLQKWIKHHKLRYEEVHLISPIAQMKDTELANVFTGLDFSSDLAYAVYNKSEIFAHGSLRKNKLDWEFGWFGSVIADKISTLTLNLAIKSLEIRDAKILGLKTIYIEFDSTDPQAMEMFKFISPHKPEILITYQTKIANAF